MRKQPLQIMIRKTENPAPAVRCARRIDGDPNLDAPGLRRFLRRGDFWGTFRTVNASKQLTFERPVSSPSWRVFRLNDHGGSPRPLGFDGGESPLANGFLRYRL